MQNFESHYAATATTVTAFETAGNATAAGTATVAARAAVTLAAI